MKFSRRRFLTITAGAAISASIGSAFAESSVWHGTAMGAQAKLVLHDLSPHESERLFRLATAEIDRLENIFSIYRLNSAISRLNQDGQLTNPPAELLELLSLAAGLHHSTTGYFDPSIQPVWKAYSHYNGRPPLSLISAARAAIGLQHVRFNSNAIRFEKPDMALTLNGIAQGFMTDRIVALLKAEGLVNAIVDMGEIAALGHDATLNPWQVGLAERSDQKAETTIAMSNQCVATSAPLGTTFDDGMSHIINPTNGLPTEPLWKRVSIVHQSAAIADGLSTALVLMNESQIRETVKRHSGIQLFAKSNENKLLNL